MHLDVHETATVTKPGTRWEPREGHGLGVDADTFPGN